MAPWVASFDWGKGSVLATSQYLVAVGPALKWNGSTILRGHGQDMMAAAESALNAQARKATGVELGFAAADDWLAAKLADPVLFKQVLLAQLAEEYQELMRLMSEDGCKWAQVGTCDWGDDSGLVKDSAWGEALLLAYSPEGSIMSDVVEAPTMVNKTGGGEGFMAKLHGIEGPMVVRPAVGSSEGRKLFEGLGGKGHDDLDAVLGEKRKGRMPSRWAGELDEVGFSDIEMDVGEVEPSVATGVGEDQVCGGLCLARIAALEETLRRVEGMVKMLVTLGGLASPTERLGVEKRKGRMAREWDVSIAKVGEQAKAEAVVKATNKRVKRRELDDIRAEEARLRQEEVVKAKEAARTAAEAERDRLVTEVKGCTGGPEAVAVAEKIVEAARMVEELEREVAASAAPVEIGGWQVVGGRKRKTVQVVSQLSRPLDGEGRKSLQGAVSKVQGLIGAANLGWGLVASPYTVHGGDEVSWTVRGVGEEVNGTEVAGTLLKNLEAVWGVGSLVGCWVENKMSVYVVLRGIPEREWLSEPGGVQGLVVGNPGITWGPRQPVVVGRPWNRVDVKMELMTAEVARGAVMRGLVYCGVKRTVHMAVGGGGASVARSRPVDMAPPRAPARVPRTGQLVQVGRAAGVGLGRTMAGGCFRCGLVGHWKNECPRMGRVDNRSCFTCGRRGHVSRDCERRVAAVGSSVGMGKGKNRVEHGPEERRLGPNENGWLEAKNTFFDDEKVQKTIEEIERSVGPSGARS